MKYAHGQTVKDAKQGGGLEKVSHRQPSKTHLSMLRTFTGLSMARKKGFIKGASDEFVTTLRECLLNSQNDNFRVDKEKINKLDKSGIVKDLLDHKEGVREARNLMSCSRAIHILDCIIQPAIDHLSSLF